MDQSALYSKLPPHPSCEGCSILNKKKAQHCIHIETSTLPMGEDVLFLSDTYKNRGGQLVEFSGEEAEVLLNALPKGINRIAFHSATNCPSLKEASMKTDDFHKCRDHLVRAIDFMKPKLIFPCGNMAMKMLIKKSGITKKRGDAFELPKEYQHQATVIPIFHPFSVIREPKNKYLLEVDIRNGINKYIFGKTDKSQFSFTPILSLEELEENKWKLDSDLLAVDIETTGFNFPRDEWMSIAISTEHGTLSIPIKHKDSPWTEEELEEVLTFLRTLLEDESKHVIMHNGKFDYKFLYRYGIRIRKMDDTMIMSHLSQEDRPHGLKDLVKEYYPEELERF